MPQNEGQLLYVYEPVLPEEKLSHLLDRWKDMIKQPRTGGLGVKLSQSKFINRSQLHILYRL